MQILEIGMKQSLKKINERDANEILKVPLLNLNEKDANANEIIWLNDKKRLHLTKECM
jgi:hypothetical protein